MVNISKDLYEISHLEISKRLTELTTFLSQTKSFSVKANSHIKVMANLINTLIESEDNLELIDKELKVSLQPSNKEPEVKQQSSSTEPTNEQKLMDKLISNFQNENDKLWTFVQKGEQNTEFLKSCFDRLLDNMSQRDKGSVNNDVPHHQDNINNINTYPYMMDQGRNPNVSVNLPQNRGSSPLRYTYNHEKPGSEQKFDPNRFYSVYEVKDYKKNHEKDVMDDQQTIKSLKEELNRVTKELKMMRKDKNNEECGLQDMVKQLLELKSESEDIIKRKDRKIDELIESLNDANNKVLILENEISFLKENNKMLEQTVNEIFSAHKKSIAYNGFDLEDSRSDLQHVIDSLRDENIDLKKQVKRLEMDQIAKDYKDDNDEYYKMLNSTLQSKMRDLEMKNRELEDKNTQLCSLIENKLSSTTNTTTRSITPDDYDIFKCIYVQGCYIEETVGFNPHLSLFNNDA